MTDANHFRMELVLYFYLLPALLTIVAAKYAQHHEPDLTNRTIYTVALAPGFNIAFIVYFLYMEIKYRLTQLARWIVTPIVKRWYRGKKKP